MTKLEELKAAYEASPGLLKCDADALDSRVFAFMCQAEALMPQLLEAVELLKGVGDVRDMAELMNLWDHKIEPVLEKLK